MIKSAQNFDGTRCGEDSQIRIRKYFELGNVDRIYKRWERGENEGK